jgi:transcriptional regulator with XRE-family HTH domain
MSQTSAFESGIAQRIKGLREALGLSAEQLAATAGVPLECVVQYESGEHEVPVSFLYKMAKSTGVDLTALITGTEAKLHHYSLVRHGEGLSVERRKAYQYQALAYRFNRPAMEPFLVSVPHKPDSEVEFNQHLGEEFIYMLEGRMEVFLGEDKMTLDPHDCLYFNSQIPHAMRALDGNAAIFLDVII